MDQQTAEHPFEAGLDRHRANFVPLSPISFLRRAVASFSDKTAVIDGERRFSYAELYERSVRLASALADRGVRRLDTVAILASNVPEMIEAHFAVPMLGAVLNPLNTRLDAATIAFSLNHGQAKVLIVDREFAALVSIARLQLDHEVLVVDIENPGLPDAPALGDITYEALLASGDPTFDAEVTATLGRIQSSGAELPAPPTDYPDMLGQSLPVGFQCTVEKFCE